MNMGGLMSIFSKLNKSILFAATAAVMSIALPAHAGWQQTFNEDFNGTSLDITKWKMFDYWGLENNFQDGDQQCYTPNNVSVSGGNLILTARQEFPLGCNPDPGTLQFTSGQISTGMSFSQAYGYFEMRAQLPSGVGLESVFRLAEPGGAFPPRPPEISVTAKDGANASEATARYSYFDEANELQTYESGYSNAALSSGFHVYGVDWQPGLLIWYVDGVERARTEIGVSSNPLYMILQLAVGNSRTGMPDASTVFPANMQVDYIRVYSRVNDGQPDTLPPGVNPPAPSDKKAPTVVYTAPVLLQRIVGDGKKFAVKVNATDNVGVTKVEFRLGNELICTDTTAPYSCDMKAPVLAKKELLRIVTIKVKAYDAAGNSTSKNREILIFNK